MSEAARNAKLQKDRLKIAHYRRLTKKVLEQKRLKQYTKEALGHTTELLELNPEFNAAWNYRRHILLSLFESGEIEREQTLNDELRMVMAQLKMYPKCYWIWNHRTWCLQQLESSGVANWKFELAIVLKLLEADSRNFHGWHYRRYVVLNIEKNAIGAAASPADQTLAALKINLAEFSYTSSKIKKNISNFSAWHNRSKLIPKIFGLMSLISDPTSLASEYEEELDLFSSPSALLAHELDLVKTGMFMDPEDTSVWKYMTWLLDASLFVDDLKSASEDKYTAILLQMLSDVQELNELEKEDSPLNHDNVWCLKLTIYIKSLIRDHEGTEQLLDDETVDLLNRLVILDPLRKGHYLDQISGKTSVKS